LAGGKMTVLVEYTCCVYGTTNTKWGAAEEGGDGRTIVAHNWHAPAIGPLFRCSIT
jgi:hypothetical protein